MIKDVTIPLKMSHHVRYSQDSTTVTGGQLIAIILADSGNTHASAACTLTGVPIAAVNSALYFNYDYTAYYYDN